MTMLEIEMVRLVCNPIAVDDGVIDRLGGDPIGMTKETWPVHDGQPLIHVITISQALVVPRLPRRAAAVAVFSSDATLPSGGKCRVVLLSTDDLARGTTRSESIWGTSVRAKGEGRIVGARSTHVVASEADLSGLCDRERNSPLEGLDVIGFSSSKVYFGDGDNTPSGQTVLFWLHCPYEVGPFSFGDANFYVSAGDTEAKAWERF